MRLGRNLNLPNLLTLLRVALAPVVVYCLVAGLYEDALLTLLAAGLTDGLDGLAARTLHMETRLGAYLDPIADKTLLSATYLAMGAAGVVPWWLVGLVFGRDLLILAMAGAALVFTRYRDFPPSVWGKLSTFCQILAGLAALVAAAFPSWTIPVAPFLWVAAAATIWSGAGYVWQGAKMARRHSETVRTLH
ncbi:MAG TPA: CDP-alcohol phosphatidyltransferase family protein [Bryobacteraceae bacterium]|nr:CDP-alcohol phosphatidyltransferase family protein [Bryobacteraceae bacterium]